MFRIDSVVKSDYANLSVHEILQAPVTALLGVTAEAASLLEKLEIFSIFDLTSSRIFKGAADIVLAAEDPDTVYSKYDGVPADIIDRDAEDLDIKDLPGESIQKIAGIGTRLGPPLAAALDIETIRDLSLWPPFQAARKILDAAYGISEDKDPEAPKELIPTAGDYPTERVFYDTIVLNEIEETGGLSPLEDAGQINILRNFKEPGFKKPAIASRLTFSQSWFPHGVSLGQLLHSLALAPGESTKVAVIDWSRRERTGVTEEITQAERMRAGMEQNRSISEVTNALATESQTGFSATASASHSYNAGMGMGMFTGSGLMGFTEGVSSSVTGGSSFSTSHGRRELSASMSQNIMNRTQQHASSSRTRRASIVRETSEEESEKITTRVVTNYNHMHALSIHYYEVVQLYRVAVKLEKCERCLCVPMKVIDFSNEEIIMRYRSVLMAAAENDYIRRLLQDAGGPVTMKLEQMNLYYYLTAIRSQELQQQYDSASTSPFSTERIIILAAKNQCGAQISATVGRLNHNAAMTRQRTGLAVGPGLDGEWRLPPEATLTKATCKNDLVTGITLVHEDGVEEDLRDDGTPAVAPKVSILDRLTLKLDKGAVGDIHGDHNLDAWVILSLNLNGVSFTVDVAFIIPRDKSLVTLLDFQPPSSTLLAANYLNENQLHYSHVVWMNTDPQSLATLLADFKYEDRSVASIIDPQPVAVAGNYLVFPCPDEMKEDNQWQKWRHENADLTKVDQELIPLPSGGVFAEAVLGRCNSAEKLDISRFWNWKDSPIPEKAPEIAPISAGTRTTPDDLKPGSLDQPIVQIQTPQALPDPTGMSAIINALTTSNMFRDMSGLAETIAMAQSGMRTTAESAVAAGSQAGANMATAGQVYTEIMKAAIPLITTALTGVPIPMTDSKTNISNAGATLNKAADLDKALKDAGGAGTGGAGDGATGGSSGSSSGGTTGGGATGDDGSSAPPSGSYEGDAVRTLIGGGGAPTWFASALLSAIGSSAFGATSAETTSDEPKPTIVLGRTGEEFEQGHITLGGTEHPEEYRTGVKTKGYRGLLSVEGSDTEFHTIERANGYKHLPEGTYSAIMKARVAHPDSHEIKILGTYTGGRIYIHPANCPDELEGCVAPGKTKEDYGVSESRDALDEIIELLGGWEEDKELVLVVRGYKTTAG